MARTWRTFTLDTTGSRGAFASIILSANKPAIAYYILDETGKLRYIRASTSKPTGTPPTEAWAWVAMDVDTLPDFVAIDINVASHVFVVDGDQRAFFPVGRVFAIHYGSFTGVYTVASVSYANGDTYITVTEDIAVSYDIANCTSTSFSVAGNVGNLFAPGVVFDVFGSTGNDGQYTSLGANYANGFTQISVASVPWVPATYGIADADETANTFKIAGDHRTRFTTGTPFSVINSTGNNGDYICSGDATFASNQTTIFVTDVVNGTDDGDIVQSADGVIGVHPDTISATLTLGGTGYAASAALIDSKPAIAYHTMRGLHLRYARASAAEPTAGDWAAHSVREVQDTARELSLAVIDGKPHIFYRNEATLGIRYGHAGVAPDEAADWTDFALHAGSAYDFRGVSPSGRPGALPCFLSIGSGRLWLHRSATAVPDEAADFSTQAITPAGLAPSPQAALGITYGVEFAVFRERTNNQLVYTRPRAWNVFGLVDTTVDEVHIDGDVTGYFNNTRAFRIAGSTDNDGAYTCQQDAVYDGSKTIIYINENLVSTTVDGVVFLTPDALTLGVLDVNLTLNYIEIDGRHTGRFKTGDIIDISSSTGNDGQYTLASDSTWQAGTTSTRLTLVEALADDTPDGVVYQEAAEEWHRHSIDAGSGVGEWAAITYDPDGLPVVVYFDPTLSRLWLAPANSIAPSETGDWTPEVVVNKDVAFVSVTANYDNTGYIIAYYDLEYWNLEVAYGSVVV